MATSARHTGAGGRSQTPSFSVKHMDRSADPAKDFYRYACGHWLDTNEIPADRARWGGFSELVDHNVKLLKAILDDSVTSRGRPGSAKRKIGDFYESAMDIKRRNELGLRPVAKELRRIGAITTPSSLAAEVANLHDQGIPVLFDAFVAPDDKNSAVYAFHLFQGGLSLPDRDYYLKARFAPLRRAYLKHLSRMFVILGETRQAAEAAAVQVMRTETALAKASKTRTALRDPHKNYHKFTTEELARRAPGFPWKAYLSERGLAKVAYVIVGQPEFFDAMSRLVRKMPKEDQKVYLRWHTLHWNAPLLDRKAEGEDFNFFKRSLVGQQKLEPSWKRAAMVIDYSIGEALGQLFVERHFTPEARAKMMELVQDLKRVFRDKLETIPWMTEKTRQRALAKLDRFNTKIGYPDKFRDYSSVRIRRDDYLGNVRRAATFEIRRKIAQVGGPIDRSEWGMTPPTVNAYYSPNLNEIVFPAGILQPPFFDFKMDDAVNLGGIGVVIGHEITHGYDDQGRKYDYDGNLRDWWTKKDTKEFEGRAKKIADEYSEFEPLPGMHVNGMLTRGENIADLGGVRLAHEALKRRLDDGRASGAKIDGLTPEQRLFISYGQIWRGKAREEEQKRLLTIDPHSPVRFRVIGPLVNVPEFWNAFKISKGSAMRRPEKKRVEIW